MLKDCLTKILNKDLTLKNDPSYSNIKIIERFKNEYSFLSNYYPCEIKYPINGSVQFIYQSVEAAFQSRKTLNPYLHEKFQDLSASKARKLGRSFITSSQLRENWDVIKLEIMYQIVKEKFIQNPDLKLKLLDTGEAELINSNKWGDTYWGVDIKSQKGENHLGKILMKIREEFKNDC